MYAKLKLYLIFLILFNFSKFCFAENKLVPLEILVSAEQSIDRHIYVNERCAGLNQAIAGKFNNSTNEKANKIASALFLRAADHSIFASTFAKKAGINYEQQYALSRALTFAKIYQKEMNRLYDLNGTFSVGIIIKDQETCDKILSNGGSIIANPKSLKQKKKLSVDQFGVLVPTKIERDIFKHDEEKNACSFGRVERYSDKITAYYGLTVAFENNNPAVIVIADFKSGNNSIGKAKSVSGVNLNSWKKFPDRPNMYLKVGQEALTDLIRIFKKYETFMGHVIKNKDQKVDKKFGKMLPIMSFNVSDKEYKVIFISEKWGEFSKCVSKITPQLSN